MKKIFYSLLLLFIVGCTNHVEISQQKLNDATKLYAELSLNHESSDRQKTLDLVTESINENPDNFLAYRFRATIYMHMNEYNLALNDIKKVTSLQPKVKTYKLLECMLQERTQPSIPWECYQEIVDSSEIKSFENLNFTKDADYITAHLFLENNNIKKYAIEAIKKENQHKEIYDIQENFINDFDRDVYLKNILP